MICLPCIERRWRLAAIALLFSVAELSGQPRAPETGVPPAVENGRSHAAMTALGESFKQLEGELKAVRERLKSKLPADEKEKLEAHIRELGEKKNELLKNLELVVTGFDPAGYNPKVEDVMDLQAETRDLLLPIIQELKSVTASPREVESLRRQVEDLQQRRSLAETAVQRLEEQIKQESDATLKPLLGELLVSWKKRQSDSDTELAVAQFKLGELEEKRGGMLGALREVTGGFFKQRGQNVLLAAFVSLLIFGSLRLLWRRVQSLPQFRRKNRSLTLRMTVVAFHVFSFLLAAFSILLVFYLAGDWVLLGLASMFLIGIAWTGKQTLPIVYEQLKMLLNLGSVREGERVIYNGLPWEVRTISVFSELRNPALDGGQIRLPLRDLQALVSRPSENEPWFPCSVDDWVYLSDGTHGKVVTQTPEWVQLVLLGGSRRTYPTAAFLDLCPENLATSFRVRTVFGVDYSHQAIATTEIAEKLQERLERDLRLLVGVDHLKNVTVDLSEAASSSLNYTILADFAGEVAHRYSFLGRAIQRICVDACNEHGWVIPFTQVTLHQAESSS